jgi:haloacetate dehalogenase
MEDFDTRKVAIGKDVVAVREKGEGAPVVLLHGYPQTSLMWHRVAPVLARSFRVVALDLPGYGRSSAPAAGPERYSKRRMAADLAAVLDTLNIDRALLVGHDRGARVAYRAALDQPGRVAAVAVLDIVPTGVVWETFDADRALRFWHWPFLAQPAPLPERMIAHDPAGFLETLMASWTSAGDLSAFDPGALAEYRAAFCEPARIAASCEDYRAGATLDRAHDETTRHAEQRLHQPLLTLWGEAFAAGGARAPLDVWREWADHAEGAPIDAGHFICEENPDETLIHLVPFLERYATTVR